MRGRDQAGSWVVGALEDMERRAVFLDGFDGAILGYSHACTEEDGEEWCCLVYSYEKILDTLVGMGMDLDMAAEHFDYNIARALPYQGAHAPIIIHTHPEPKRSPFRRIRRWFRRWSDRALLATFDGKSVRVLRNGHWEDTGRKVTSTGPVPRRLEDGE